ncbi:hypothetical protein MUY27_05505 [Mucilaginibacter sp. RS28]|uniref:Uncharacterized protein n=1 Tax=Mucilaginibacter straminoryzae TaxID=2932774 RepID=A0A9X1X0Z4_9SPHI|nr:hypothetical protein [Mucilaginibacter straminoryzae]MCJ8209154.1 hypothetical protein [Mucilaginibacter straminoryzae]
METLTAQHSLAAIRWRIGIVIAGLFISGVTAFPLQSELELLSKVIPSNGLLGEWLHRVNTALTETQVKYPFLNYGTDWLAFAHIMFAVLFIGPWIDPVKNTWVTRFGLIACIAILPLAFIAGSIRGIPFFWQLIDCSFGVFCFIPLWSALKRTNKLIQKENKLSYYHVS